MIDINELRRLAQAATPGPDGVSLSWIRRLQDFQQGASPAAISELLDRLEAAEKDVALKERIIDSLGSTLNAMTNERDALRTENAALVEDMNLLRNNNTALRAKIEAMEKQKPVGKFIRHPSNGLWEQDGYGDNPDARPLYALPGAQPQLDEIKIALQRALELGARETWTGARKHRSWEDQREEQQCWNKVWSLLDAKGEEK